MAANQEIIETGKRYAIVDVEAGLVRRVMIAPLETDDEGKVQSVTVNVPQGHIAVEAPVSIGMVANRPVKGVRELEDAVAKAKTDAKKAASAAAKKAAEADAAKS